MLNDFSVRNAEKLCNCNPRITLVSFQMNVQSDKIFVSYRSMNGDSQLGMLFKHPLNEINEAFRSVFWHFRIVLGVRQSDVLTSGFGWFFYLWQARKTL